MEHETNQTELEQANLELKEASIELCAAEKRYNEAILARIAIRAIQVGIS